MGQRLQLATMADEFSLILEEEVKYELFATFLLLLGWILVDHWALVWALVRVMWVTDQKSCKIALGMKISFC